MAVIIQLRNDTSTNWASVNPVLAEGELGFETDTGKAKLGDGISGWTALSYYSFGVSGTDVQVDGTSITVNNEADLTAVTLAGPVRGVKPACTTITAADTTVTLTANTTYAHQPATGCTYTLTTPTDLTVYSGFILMIDTTNSASIAFQTDDSPATSIVLNGNPTIATGKKYTVTGQYSVLNNAWELWIIEYSAT